MAAAAMGPEVLDPEVFQKCVEAAENGLKLFNKYVEEITQFKVFEETVKKLNDSAKGSSVQAAEHMSKMVTLLKEAQNEFKHSVGSVLEWSNSSVVVLDVYIEQMDAKEPGAKLSDEQGLDVTRDVLVEVVMNKGISALTDAINNLRGVNQKFADSSGECVKLTNVLSSDRASDSAYMQGKIAEIRAKGYGSAAAGAAFGLPGLVVSYSIAAGVVEGEQIPKLQNMMDESIKQTEAMQAQLKTCQEASDQMEAKVHHEIKTMQGLRGSVQGVKKVIGIFPIWTTIIKGKVVSLRNELAAYQGKHQQGGAA
jgi:hypothetical protein